MNPHRPTSLLEYVGQPAAVSELCAAIASARRRGTQLDHFLVTGPAGVGKTSLVGCVAAELGVPLVTATATAIEHKGHLASLLATLTPGAVLFIDEIHALPKKNLFEVLYSALEDGVLDMPAGARVVRVELPRFTLAAATTKPGALPRPLIDRFGHQLQLYPHGEDSLLRVVMAAASRMGVSIAAEAAAEIARRSRGTPRVALRLLRRVVDRCPGFVDLGTATAALDTIVDRRGLDAQSRAYLAIVADRGPMGLEAIAQRLGVDRGELEDGIEPFLIASGLVERTSKGRVVTETGRAALPLRLVA
jgi:Holliday junction DNA helicase RuvB